MRKAFCVGAAFQGGSERQTCALLYNTYVNFDLAETGKCAFFSPPNPVSGP